MASSESQVEPESLEARNVGAIRSRSWISLSHLESLAILEIHLVHLGCSSTTPTMIAGYAIIHHWRGSMHNPIYAGIYLISLSGT